MNNRALNLLLCGMNLFFRFSFPAVLLLCACGAAKKAPLVKHTILDTLTVSAANNPLDIYRESPPLIWDILTQEAELAFDFSNKIATGKTWITYKPYARRQDSLVLDAKNMDILTVAVPHDQAPAQPLDYRYDGEQLFIALPQDLVTFKPYSRVYIAYQTRSEQTVKGGSAAIGEDKGLYFINTDKKIPGKPVQIWTQGETESNSNWLPTLDKPNQRLLISLALIVPDSMQTLSNGALLKTEKLPGNQRLDYWTMDLPIQPYAIMFAIGKFVKTEDSSWNGKEVSYYTEKEFAPYAKGIFKNTRQMMDYFSHITGVPYPWNKYSQIIVRDYVSGAMENTTASLFGEFMNQNHRELADKNYEDIVSHELFHQWFGDYVTQESWSNITLSESFANYGEILWRRHHYGTASADEHRFSYLQSYLNAATYNDPPLQRFHYRQREDVFDRISYQKGGLILNYLNGLMGDTLFQKAMNRYLTQNALQPAEVSDWRKAVEWATGQDWNWFFDQWYLKGDHPVLKVQYRYDDSAQLCRVTVTQNGKEDTLRRWRLPLKMAVYYNGAGREEDWLVAKRTTTFEVPYQNGVAPLIIPDARHWLPGEWKENKSLAQWQAQFQAAPDFRSRRTALTFAFKNKSNTRSLEMVKQALHDSLSGIRRYVLTQLGDVKMQNWQQALTPQVQYLAAQEPHNLTRAAAISVLGNWKISTAKSEIMQALADSSYAVSGAALEAYSMVDSAGAYAFAKSLLLRSDLPRAQQEKAMWELIFRAGQPADWPAIQQRAGSLYGGDKIAFAYGLATYAFATKDSTAFAGSLQLLQQLTASESIRGYRQGLGEALILILTYYNGHLSDGGALRRDQAAQIVDRLISEEPSEEVQKAWRLEVQKG